VTSQLDAELGRLITLDSVPVNPATR
jgi:hypothetical protein